MVTIVRQSNGRHLIQFAGLDGNRKTVRLGKVPQKSAETVKTKVEALVAAALIRQSLDDETAKWVRDLPDGIAEKLATVGLIASRESTFRTLSDFLDAYV